MKYKEVVKVNSEKGDLHKDGEIGHLIHSFIKEGEEIGIVIFNGSPLAVVTFKKKIKETGVENEIQISTEVERQLELIKKYLEKS